jgi:hypothetical protein
MIITTFGSSDADAGKASNSPATININAFIRMNRTPFLTHLPSTHRNSAFLLYLPAIQATYRIPNHAVYWRNHQLPEAQTFWPLSREEENQGKDVLKNLPESP